METARAFGPTKALLTKQQIAHVSNQAKQRVDAEVARCLALAERKYGRAFKTPAVTYRLRGRTAGRAWHTKNLIELNGGLFADNEEEMVLCTTPHELAHIVDNLVYPRKRTSSGHVAIGDSGHVGAHRCSHGPTFKEVMRLFGADASRTHRMDTSRVAVSVNSVTYVCSACKAKGRDTSCAMGKTKSARYQQSVLAYGQQNFSPMRYRLCKHTVLATDLTGYRAPPAPAADTTKKFVFTFTPRPPRFHADPTPVRIPALAEAPKWKDVKQVVNLTDATIGKTARRLIGLGLSDADVLAEVLRAFPSAKTTMNCIRWYRNKERTK